MGRLNTARAIVQKKYEREGIYRLAKSVSISLNQRRDGFNEGILNPEPLTFVDVLFINGCDYSVPHPIRYRVTHQMEQLESNGLSTMLIEARDLQLADVAKARSFVIFRCPSTLLIEQFIALAKMLNKKVFYDIDDLVIDTRYTDTIPYLDTLSPEERAGYDDGVRRMGRTLMFCDCAITTTEGMAKELAHYVPETFVNRNTASEDMLYYSEKALYVRDTLPLLDESDVTHADKTYWRWAREQKTTREKQGCVIGYFSGSITHNDDFNMILPALIQVLKERPNVQLKVLGELDIPKELEPYRSRIITDGFISWKQLPEAIASVDINVAPLVETVFNEAKSENKWVEAALVKTPTIASNVGAFKQMISHQVTGVLVSNDVDSWRDALLGLVDSPERRSAIAESAYEYCKRNCTTIRTGKRLVDFIRDHQSKNVFFHLPSLNISGGVLVTLKHCCLLQDAGFDVGIIDQSGRNANTLFSYDNHVFPVYKAESTRNFEKKVLLAGRIDVGVATLFDTLALFRGYSNVGRIVYLVQNYETDFYDYAHLFRQIANATYGTLDVEFVTISQWCQQWLKDDYGQDARYVPNGIDLTLFKSERRDFNQGKIRILIEGNSKSDYKNVDESFVITNKLDRSKFEVWYLSYDGKPKDWYKYDRFLHKVPYDQMGEIYRDCHILLKTSLLESFSYPPLEMMATGGFVVAIPNDGNREYLVDEENCLLFEHGDTEAGLSCIDRLVGDSALRETLYQNGMKCASSRDWKAISEEITNLYS